MELHLQPRAKASAAKVLPAQKGSGQSENNGENN